MPTPITIANDLYPEFNPTTGEREPGYQCYGCRTYIGPEHIGQTWFDHLVDLDPGNPEVGPDPDLQEVLLCPTCHARVEAGGPLELPEED